MWNIYGQKMIAWKHVCVENEAHLRSRLNMLNKYQISLVKLEN